MNPAGRVQRILLRPAEEWLVIAREPGDAKSLYAGYLAFLALIPAIAGFISSTFLGVTVPAGTVRLSFGAGLLGAVYSYVLTLAIVYIAALVLNALAPHFGGEKNFPNALKLSVYCNTPYCVASAFLLIPPLKFLVVLGLYGLYLFYLGAPILMKSPKRRSAFYAVMVFIIVFIIALPLGAVQALFWA
jgi:hypothetical protein